jgi:hypothetical protein
VAGGVGNVFRSIVATDGCDKCSQNDGGGAATDPDPRVREHYHAILEDVEFRGCRTPVRVASSGRFLLERVHMTSEGGQFECDGPRFSSDSDATRATVEMRGSVIEGCRRGVRFGRGGEGLLRSSSITGCTLRGLRAGAGSSVSVESTSIVGNGGEGSAESGYGGVAVEDGGAIDLGGGTLVIDGAEVHGAGGNTICGNRAPDGSDREVDNAGAATLAATQNWWCSAQAPTSHVVGPVAFDPVLERAPLPSP